MKIKIYFNGINATNCHLRRQAGQQSNSAGIPCPVIFNLLSCPAACGLVAGKEGYASCVGISLPRTPTPLRHLRSFTRPALPPLSLTAPHVSPLPRTQPHDPIYTMCPSSVSCYRHLKIHPEASPVRIAAPRGELHPPVA